MLNPQANMKNQTADLALAAALSCKGHKVINSIRAPSGRVTFCFQETESFHDDMNDYWNQDMRVEPSSYFTAIKNLKAIIYNKCV